MKFRTAEIVRMKVSSELSMRVEDAGVLCFVDGMRMKVSSELPMRVEDAGVLCFDWLVVFVENASDKTVVYKRFEVLARNL